VVVQLLAIIILPAIKAAAAQHLVVITHVVALCKYALVAIGKQVTAALAAQTPVPRMDGNLNGVIQAPACIHLVFVADLNTANQDVHVLLQSVCVY
jgi:hypothetical protein